MKLSAVNSPFNPMDLPKRKRTAADDNAVTDNDRNRRRHRRANGDEKPKDRADDHGSAVNDAEVEEFYAILQRMRETRCAAAARSNAVEKTETERIRWRPSFSWEDFAAVKGDGEGKSEGGDGKGEEAVRVRGLDLDLNAEPEPEGGERTARCAAGLEA